MADRYVVAYNSTTGRLEIAQAGDRYVLWQNVYISADLELTGNMVVAGTVDGRNISVDGVKLDLLTASGAIDLDIIKTKTDWINVTQAVDLDALESRIDALVAAVVLKGTWAPSGGVFPTSTVAGESWIASDSGTINAIPFATNDRIVALVDGASTSVYLNNWHKFDYTDEVLSVAGKTGAVVLLEADITDLQTYLTAVDIDSMAKLNILVNDTILTTAGIDTLSKINTIIGDATLDDSGASRTPLAHTHPRTDLPELPAIKSYNFASRSASSGEYFLAGFYDYAVADSNLTQASITQVFGSANSGHAGKAFLVFGAASTDGSTVTLIVTGTSIALDGTRTAADSEVLYTGAVGGLTLDDYLETTKRWIGQVTYTLTSDGTTFTFDFNYGLVGYEDNNSVTFKVIQFEVSGLCDISDSGFNVELLHHNDAGWTYHASAFVAGGAVLCGWGTDYSTEDELIAGEHFSYKRNNLVTTPASGDGVLVRITTTANAAIKYMNVHIGILVTY